MIDRNVFERARRHARRLRSRRILHDPQAPTALDRLQAGGAVIRCPWRKLSPSCACAAVLEPEAASNSGRMLLNAPTWSTMSTAAGNSTGSAAAV
jgi:hypothetical protein